MEGYPVDGDSDRQDEQREKYSREGLGYQTAQRLDPGGKIRERHYVKAESSQRAGLAKSGVTPFS